MPSRRSFLLGAGGTVAAAGCVSTGDDASTATPTRQPSVDVTVENVGVKKAVTYESLMGSGGVLTAEGRQYVVASVSASDEVSPSDFTFQAGDDAWKPGLPDTAGGTNRSVAGREGRPLDHPHSPEGAVLAFDLPSPLSASDPLIRYSGSDPGTWPLDDGAAARLEAPEPCFELASLEVPSEVQQGEPLEVSMSVRNVSGTDGRFLASVYWPTHGIADDDESHVVEREVSASEEVTISRSIDTRYTVLEDGRVTLRVDGHVGARREVAVDKPSNSE